MRQKDAERLVQKARSMKNPTARGMYKKVYKVRHKGRWYAVKHHWNDWWTAEKEWEMRNHPDVVPTLNLVRLSEDIAPYTVMPWAEKEVNGDLLYNGLDNYFWTQGFDDIHEGNVRFWRRRPRLIDYDQYQS